VRHLTLCFLLALVVSLPTCVTTKSADAIEAQSSPMTMPNRVYVTDFQIDPSLVQTDSGILGELREHGPLSNLRRRMGGPLQPKTPEELAKQLPDVFSQTLVQELVNAAVPAERLSLGASLPREGWIVRGQFVKVDEGSAPQRAIVGFGVGGPQIEVAGDVSDLSTDPPTSFLTFGGTNKTKRMPGGIIMRNPYVMAAKFVLTKGATERDVKELAARMASEIVAYMKEQRLLPETR